MGNLEIFKGSWRICVDGYAFRHHKNGRQEIVPASDKWTTYNPFDNAGLFLEFAATDESEDAVLEFTNLYGLLGSAPVYLDDWNAERVIMKRATDAWQGGKRRGLDQVVGHITHLMNGSHGISLEPPHPPLVFMIDGDTLNMHFVPLSLLVALYIQFAQAIQGNKKFRQCAWCGVTFELTPSIARTNRLFCSNSCKQADYRHRKGGKRS
jgi:hypothetical protein